MKLWLVLLLALAGCGGRSKASYPAEDEPRSYPNPSSGPEGYELTPVRDAAIGGAPSGPKDAGAAVKAAGADAGAAVKTTGADAGAAVGKPRIDDTPLPPEGLPPTPVRLDIDGGLGAPIVGDAAVKPPVHPFE